MPTPATSTTSVPSVGTVTSVEVDPTAVPDDRVLVVVELNGGNDAVNTLVPDLGSYRDHRPTIALPEADLLRIDGISGHSLHPSLAPLQTLFGDDRIATIASVGFPDPDRSHFTSTDRWHRADRMDETLGWLGRWLDSLPSDLPALGATALGDTGRSLDGATRRGSAIADVDAFAFPPGLSNADIRALAVSPADDPLIAAAQAAFASSVGAVAEFDPIADAVRARAGDGSVSTYAPPTGPFSTGLAVASELLRANVGTRVVTVTGGGFDTHSEQLGKHAALLDDLATGIAEFWRAVDESGDADRVLLMTTSEFGRRVTQNASEGCDHGSAGLSFLIGPGVTSGLRGTIDTDHLVDGDLEPHFDPRTMYTACLDWLGADVERVLGARSDELSLLA